VYAPAKSRVVVKFSAVPKKDKAELKSQPNNATIYGVMESHGIK